MEGGALSNKRPRDESAESPETKRLREADIILEILDDDDADVGLDPAAADGIDDVIKGLEEEIAAPATEEQEVDGPRQLDLGYLLEASDDELGLPPASVSSSSASPLTDVGGAVEVTGDVAEEEAAFDPIWGFEDEIALCPYEGFGLGIETGFDDDVTFDGGLFDCSDVVCGPSDYENLTWRTESLPSI